MERIQANEPTALSLPIALASMSPVVMGLACSTSAPNSEALQTSSDQNKGVSLSSEASGAASMASTTSKALDSVPSTASLDSGTDKANEVPAAAATATTTTTTTTTTTPHAYPASVDGTYEDDAQRESSPPNNQKRPRHGCSADRSPRDIPAGCGLGASLLGSTVDRRDTRPPHDVHQSKSGSQQTVSEITAPSAARATAGKPKTAQPSELKGPNLKEPRQVPTAVHTAGGTRTDAQPNEGQAKRRRVDSDTGEPLLVNRRGGQQMLFQKDETTHQQAAADQLSSNSRLHGTERPPTAGSVGLQKQRLSLSMSSARLQSELRTQVSPAVTPVPNQLPKGLHHDAVLQSNPPQTKRRLPIVKTVPKKIPTDILDTIHHIATEVVSSFHYTNDLGDLDLEAVYLHHSELWKVLPEAKIEERIDIAVKTLEYHAQKSANRP